MNTNQPIISVKNISKKYNITHQQGGYVALRDVIADIVKKPLSFLKRRAKAITGRTTKEIFWALKDIDFEIQKGEAVGIIGPNGAGKSTLLKILTGITPPTTGEIKMHGKVASLLEVGTGFHQELTGRENIFLNGAILGMTKEEIVEKFDAIVEFSGVQKFIDTPVKRYSSGMMVRLGFSVAAHMEPDILLVDEVLAVGDAEFQKKCLGKMDEVTSQAGRTILFVSHNMSAIQKLCKRCILLEEGKIKMIGETKEVIKQYLGDIPDPRINNDLSIKKRRGGLMNVKFTKISFYEKSGGKIARVISGQTVIIGLSYFSKTKKILNDCRVSISFSNMLGEPLFVCSSDQTKTEILKLPPTGEIRCKINNFPLNKGKYTLSVLIATNREIEDWIENAIILEVNNGDFYSSGSKCSYWEGRGVLVKHTWLL